MIGQTVSHYRILSELGKGAMSIVYLAKDKRLNRYVAIKMLGAEHLTRTNQNHSRLLREARAISQINHPNIATIYDYGETQDGHPFIAMEYIEGETLADILKRKSLSVSYSVEIIAAVAAALAEAHGKGIIHRDIKPSNIIINKRGEVKVLDFGLAKQIEGFAQVDVTDSVQGYAETQTREGVVVGTPLYLSPEQALGGPIDQRSDIFSLGSVFYECLTGQPPFQAPSIIEICARIIRDEPILPSKINSEITKEVDSIVIKSLAKDPDKRYQSSIELSQSFRKATITDEFVYSRNHSGAYKNLYVQTESNKFPKTFGFTPEKTEQKSSKLGLRLSGILARAFPSQATTVSKIKLSLLALLFFSIAGFISYSGYQVLTKKSAISSLSVSQLERMQLQGDIPEIAISPDGNWIAWVSKEPGGQVINITEKSNEKNSFPITPLSNKDFRGLIFSPDGAYIYYLEHQNETETATLHRVTKLGQDRRQLVENINTPISFSPDGSQITFVRFDLSRRCSILMISDKDGNNMKEVLSLKHPPEMFSPTPRLAGPIWHPTLDNIIVCPTTQMVKGTILFHFNVIDLKDSSRRRINEQPFTWLTSLYWLNDGSGFLATGTKDLVGNGQIYFISYPDGQMKKLSESPDSYTRLSLTKDSSVLLTLRYSIDSSIWLMQQNVAEEYKTIKGFGVKDLVFLPNDELIYTLVADNNQNIWQERIENKSSRQLTFNDEASYSPTVSSDGRYIFFVSYRGEAQNVWRINSNGMEQKQVTTGNYEDTPQVTPDNKWIIYHSTNSLWKMPFDGGEPSLLLNKVSRYPAVSPDGKFLASFTLESKERAKWQLEVFSFDNMLPVKTFTLPDGVRIDSGLRWTFDGDGLAYVNDENQASNLFVQYLDNGKIKKVTNFKSQTIFSFAWSKDGKNLALSRGSEFYSPYSTKNFIQK